MPVGLGVRSLDMGVWIRLLGMEATAGLIRLAKKCLMHGVYMTC